MKYTEVNFTVTPYSEDVADVLISELGTIGFDGFCNSDTGFMAYIPSKDFDGAAISQLDILPFFAERFTIRWTHTEIEEQNWNKTWEENFTPIVVDNRILVRSGFHEPIKEIEYEIIIEPEMSFGSGHHSTTSLMLKTILDYRERIKGKRVLDMGCGTGILSVMASKAGAAAVIGIDIDEWAFNNAVKNIAINRMDNITVKIGDAALLADEQPFDVILANINRNILLNDMQRYTQKLSKGGYLILSGFYTQDLPIIQQEAEKQGLSAEGYKEDNNWVAACFYKN